MKRAVLDTAKLNMDLGIIVVEIIGESTTELPVMGKVLIVRAPEIKGKDYPYECFSCPESFLEGLDL